LGDKFQLIGQRELTKERYDEIREIITNKIIVEKEK
jgi:hypothetical protein